MLEIWKFFPIENLNVGIVGDILHSRVALSNIFGLLKAGAKVKVCGPPHLIQKKSKAIIEPHAIEHIISRLQGG